jgi:sigma-B regulation protein RsbU (phosphoserine phosphatase)
MMTFFIAMIDFKTDSLTFANAGHQASWVFTPTESGVSEMSSLILPGRRLGEEREVSSFEEKTVHFKSGDSLFLYTDGLVDAVGKDDSKFGKRRAKDVVQANVGHGPEHVVKSLVKDFMSHVELKPLDDDLTMVALRRI